MADAREFHTVVLAGLLHDAGKFLQRGRTLSLDIEGRHPEVSARFVSAFSDTFAPQILPSLSVPPVSPWSLRDEKLDSLPTRNGVTGGRHTFEVAQVWRLAPQLVSLQSPHPVSREATMQGPQSDRPNSLSGPSQHGPAIPTPRELDAEGVSPATSPRGLDHRRPLLRHFLRDRKTDCLLVGASCRSGSRRVYMLPRAPPLAAQLR